MNMNPTRLNGPIPIELGVDRMTASFLQTPSGPFATLNIASIIRLYATPGATDPAVLRDLAAKATEIADWLEQNDAGAGELDAA